MEILVIGNGFDLAHGLPTEYADFLEFLRLYVADDEEFEKATIRTPELARFVKKLKSDDEELNREVHGLLARPNCLLAHFNNVCEQRCLEGKKGWVDFETEISQIVQLFEGARKEEKAGAKYLSPDLTKKIEPFIFSPTGDYYAPDRIPVYPGFTESMIKNRLHELNILTRLLEIYLASFIDKLDYVDTKSQIADLSNITHVLSFNYTSTYQRLYGKHGIKYCYIHGKAENKSSLDACNLVLGIDEYLGDEAQNNDNAFIWFKKFYQRIYKETSSDYIDWLDDFDFIRHEQRSLETQHMFLDIYFYGHSLDATDKDVLSMLILHENVRSHIFYRSKASMAKQITNLCKIIGEKNLIRMTRGENRSIIFEPIAPVGLDEA